MRSAGIGMLLGTSPSQCRPLLQTAEHCRAVGPAVRRRRRSTFRGLLRVDDTGRGHSVDAQYAHTVHIVCGVIARIGAIDARRTNAGDAC